LLRPDVPFEGAERVSPDAATVELGEIKRRTTPLILPEKRGETVAVKRETGYVDETVAVADTGPLAPVKSNRRRNLAVIGLVGIVGIGATFAVGLRRQGEKAVGAIPALPVSAPPLKPLLVTTGTETTPVGPPETAHPAPPPAGPKGHQGTEETPRVVVIEPSRSGTGATGQTEIASLNREPAHKAPADSASSEMYQRAVNIVGGRDVKLLSRAELLQAMQYFQNVKNGPNQPDAGRQADRLGREIDRRTWKK
jgi:hypothetical protein